MSSAEKFSRRSGIERVVGVDEEKEKEILDEVEEIFSREEAEQNELSKTLEEKQIISFLGERLPQFATTNYGARPLLLGENQIVLEKPTLFQSLLNKAKALFGYEVNIAYYAPDKQRIYYVAEAKESGVSPSFYFVKFAHTLAHEILHFLSFQSLQFFRKKDRKRGDLFQKGEILETRRIGLAINVKERKNRSRYYFSQINEGIIELLVDRFFADELIFEGMPKILKESLEKQKRIKKIYQQFFSAQEWEHIEKYFASGIILENFGSSPADWLVEIARPNQRIMVLDLIEDLYEKNKLLFSKKEEIFNIFAEAVMAGKLLPLARLIERTYGKGSFRRIGKEASEIVEWR